MKTIFGYIVVGILALLMMAPSVYAGEGLTDDGLYKYMNEEEVEYDHHHHKYYMEEDNDFSIGAGLDVVVYEKGNFSTVIEGKVDTTNERSSVYAVGKINLWRMLKKEK